MWLEILLILLSLFLALYRLITKQFGKWKNLGIPHAKGSFPFGSYNFFISGKHLDELSAESHHKFASEKYFGWFLLGRPVLAINDVNLLKHIEVKDFDHFVDRQSKADNEKQFAGGDLDQIWKLQLTSITGDDWKEMRQAFTPIFTSGKMKGMLKFIKHVAGDLTKEIDSKAKKGEEFELKEVFGKFSMDGISSTAFGVNSESFTNENSKFVKNAAAMFRNSNLELLLAAVKFIPGVPQVLNLLKLDSFKPKETRFFRDIILQTIKIKKKHQREKK
eukprot:TRINITY_DN4688_c0_g1_i1.p1 TRINITY_DN4688_c0_g1~~TRINITY_DN4688_c0_g1_i1.p1  ORF type:complete len:276 (-),score=79.30 TRINITY_DN4688_c0_g1_i1:677-1504(-)